MDDQERNENDDAAKSEQAEGTEGQLSRDRSKESEGSVKSAPKAESVSADTDADTEGHYKRH